MTTDIRSAETAVRCSVIADLLGDPLTATALEVTAWVLIEHSGPWGKNALTESGLDPDVASELSARERASGVRPQLVSPPVGSPPAWAYLGVLDGTGRPVLGRVRVRDPRELLDLDFAALADGYLPPGAELLDEPLYIVCANEAGDPCCGLTGRAVHAAATEVVGDRARRTAHVGGHKFAANLVAFPSGDYYGRLDRTSVVRVVEAAELGQIDMVHHRGRSTWATPEQAAADVLHRRFGVTGANDVVLVERAREIGPRTHVSTFDVKAVGRYEVVVRSADQDAPRLQSCTDANESTPVRWVELSAELVAGRTLDDAGTSA